jgi:hypothetical protein
MFTPLGSFSDGTIRKFHLPCVWGKSMLFMGDLPDGMAVFQHACKMVSNVARNCPLCVMKNSPHPWLHGLG